MFGLFWITFGNAHEHWLLIGVADNVTALDDYYDAPEPSMFVKIMSWILFFGFMWFVIDFADTMLKDAIKKEDAKQQVQDDQRQAAYKELISKERNLVQCYQDGKVFVTYLAGHIEPNCETIKRGKHDIYTTCNQAITFTIIDSNTNITVGIANCQVTELAPLD